MPSSIPKILLDTGFLTTTTQTNKQKPNNNKKTDHSKHVNMVGLKWRGTKYEVPMDREFPRPPREVLLQQPVVIFVFIIVY
jgi:hypothetical protein